jgi:HEAT repeat protein
MKSILFAAVATFVLSFTAATAQDTTPPPRQSQPSEPVAQPPVQPSPSTQSFEPNEIRAWSLLTESVAPGRSSHDRIQALAALGTMGNNDRAAKLIGDAIVDHESDVRIAAILAAGLTKNPALIPRLRQALDDDNPQVAYTAAITLWKMQDTSGQDLLAAVALGDRKAKPGLIKSEKHKADKDLHSPKTLAMIAVNQGSGYFLGPFGVGLKAIEMVDKNSGAATRAAAIGQLAQQHSDEVRETLIQDLTDAEPAVRAAAAKGLGRWPGEDTEKQLAPMFGDNKLAVRLTAAAAYLRALDNIPTPPDCSCDTH